MKRIYGFFTLLWLAGLRALGQNVRLSDNPEQFLGDVQKLMNSGGPVAQKAAKDLEGIWTANTLSAPQKERVLAISRKMNAKRLAPAPYFAPFYEALYHLLVTQSATAQNVDNFLAIVDKSVDNPDTKALNRLLETTRLFAETRQLYASNYNKLRLNGGTFTFRPGEEPATGTGNATGTGKPDAAKPQPETSRFDGWDTPLDSVNKTPLVAVLNRRPLPALSGPVLEVKGDLVMVTASDSVVIRQTEGGLALREGQFVGKSGTFTWESAGQPETYVTLADYAFQVMNPRLSADDVALTHPRLTKPVKGTFEFVSKKRNPGQLTDYPRFMSWQNDATLTNLNKNLEYRGGLTLAGTKLFSTSVSKQPAMLKVSFQGKPAFRVSSQRFEFSADSVVTAPLAEFAGYIDAADSLYHPGVRFHYDQPNGILKLYRADGTRFADAYYSNSYHKFYIQPEVLRWELNKQRLDFYQLGAKREVPVRFESYDFFHPERYSGMTIDYGFHPLQVAANYVSTKKTQTFLADELAQFAKIKPNVMREVMGRMVTDGYIDMDPRTELMRLSRKGVLYVLANAGKKDYDNFLIRSLYTSSDSVTNASIDLKDRFMTIRGVERFVISDSLKIYAVPSDKTLRIGKNRAFTLNGQLKSGNFRYSGRDLAFNYDQFSMNLNKIDSITFPPKGKNTEVGGDIRYEKPGTVYLGAADNKSGRIKDKKTTQRLVMPEGMTVYFDQKDRGDILYNKKVYFKIPAIDNDSIGKSDIAFVGTFHSDGILPPIQATLVTMPDNSLGFIQKAPANGYPLYGGKGNLKATGELRMDKKGLRTDGVLNHLAASLSVKDVLLMTDSLLAMGAEGQIKEGPVGKAYFPAVALKNYTLKWYPKSDSLQISTKGAADRSFDFYNGTTSLKGDLVVRSTGLFGRGTVRRTDAEAVSESIKFNKEGFLANNAQFRVNAAGQQAATAKPVLLGRSVDVDFNQVKGMVLISRKNTSGFSDTLSSSLELPYAAYRTSINQAQWNIREKTVAMKGDVKTSTFTATAPEQEGLTFNAAAALYDVEKATLNISGVPYIVSADARIFPEKGLVSIKRNGEMMALKNARLELDTVSRFHRLKNGSIQVLSRARFSGNATYQFATSAGDTASIKMESFELKEGSPAATAVASRTNRRPGKESQLAPAFYTVATADIDEADNLMLAPKMTYKGNITMMAPDPELKLDGFIKPALKKRPDLVSGWIPFKEKVTEKISIRVDKNLKNEGGALLVAGLHFRGGGAAGLYPSFLSPKENDKDDDLFVQTGMMTYDEKEKLFRVVAKDENGLDDVEGAFTFDDAKGVMTFRGPLGVMASQQPGLVLAGGSGRAHVDSNTVRLNALVAFGFAVPQPVNQAIAEKIVKVNGGEKNDEAADDDLGRLTDKLSAIIGRKAAEAYRTKAQNQHVPVPQASPKLAQGLVLSNLNLRWSEKHNTFYSVGTIGVSNLDATDINAQMEGFVEIRKAAGGDEVTIYLEGSPDDWFYWDYKPGGTGLGQLALVTSDPSVNDRITAGGKNSGKDKLEVVPADLIEKTQFVDRYLDTYKTKAKPKPQPKVVKKDPAKKEEKKKDKEDTREGF